MNVFYESDSIISKKIKTSIGNDVHIPFDFILPAKSFKTIDLNLKVLIPDGYWIQIEGRSGLATKYGIFPIGGIIDCDYTGNIKITMVNMNDKEYHFRKGDKICQFILRKEHHANFEKVDCNNEYFQKIIKKKKEHRGDRGFGSTGK